MTAWGAKQDDPDLSSAMATPMLAMAGARGCAEKEIIEEGFLPNKVSPRMSMNRKKMSEKTEGAGKAPRVARANEPNKEPSGFNSPRGLPQS